MATRKSADSAENVKAEPIEQKFSKEQILASAKYANKRDLVDALLTNSEKYTMEEIDKKISNYLEGKVK